MKVRCSRYRKKLTNLDGIAIPPPQRQAERIVWYKKHPCAKCWDQFLEWPDCNGVPKRKKSIWAYDGALLVFLMEIFKLPYRIIERLKHYCKCVPKRRAK